MIPIRLIFSKSLSATRRISNVYPFGYLMNAKTGFLRSIKLFQTSCFGYPGSLIPETTIQCGKRVLPVALALALLLQALPLTLPANRHAGRAFAETRPASAPDAFPADGASGGSSKTIQGSVTSIRVTRGRSQIVKFAQPIARLSIAEPTVADIIPLAPDQIMINGKLRGVTSLIVWDEEGQEGIFDLYVQNDVSELLDAVRSVAPSEPIQARVTDDSFILTGKVSNSVVLDEIRKTASAYGYRDDKFIDLTDTPVPQVMLEVRIAEANRSISNQLKTAYQYHSSAGNLNVTRLANPLDSSFLSTVSRATGGLIPGSFGPVRTTQAGTNTGGLTGAVDPIRNFSFMWDMLETTGKVNTLANPTLVCTHGRTASFLAGGQFPFVGSVDQNGSPIVQYKEFGVKLNFTPWISVKSGLIEMNVQPEVSNLDSSTCVNSAAGNRVCGIMKRATDTTVELKDGETLMISGILSREEQNTLSQLPFIGNVPVLGHMFKNGSLSKTDRELVIVITPHIVKPSDYGKVLGAAPPN